MALAPFEAAAVALGAGAALLSVAGTLHAARWAWAPPRLAQGWRPFASVLVPCKGHHPGLHENALAFARQDYPAYELLFLVDAKDDPCVEALERAAAEEPRIRIALAGPSTQAATGKVAAQLSGVVQASTRAEVLVFADADARPPPRWLAALVEPLGDPRVGGVTGYRWYLPEGRATPWTMLRDAWNAVGLDALTMRRFRFLWGGSMAVRRADFDRSDVRARWATTVVEDVALTRAIEGLGLSIAFAPGAMVASPEMWTREEVQEWVVRQAALTRVAMPHLFLFAGLAYGASLVSFAVGLVLLAGGSSEVLAWAGAAMLLPVLTAAPRAALRDAMVRRHLPLARARPPAERVAHLALAVLMPLAMLPTLAAARRVRAIAWRGRTYPLS